MKEICGQEFLPMTTTIGNYSICDSYPTDPGKNLLGMVKYVSEPALLLLINLESEGIVFRRSQPFAENLCHALTSTDKDGVHHNMSPTISFSGMY